MKKSLLFIAFLLAACGTEKSVNPGKPTTFVKYFNGGNNDFAQAVRQTSDGGYIILAYSQLKKTDISVPHYKIKLIKTDAFGVETWQQVYPAYGSDTGPNGYISYKANALAILPDGGYVLVGEDIQSDQTSRLLMLTVGPDGSQQNIMTYPSSGFTNIKSGTSVSGQAVELGANGNYLVLSSVDTSNYNMAFAEASASDLSLNWNQTYGAGVTTVANKIFLDAGTNLIASGTMTKDNSTSKVMFLKAPVNSFSSVADNLIGDTQFSQTGADICSFGPGYAVTGTTSQFGNVILFNLIDLDGRPINNIAYPTEIIGGNATPIVGSGNAITATSDGSFVILATITGTTSDDYCLMKVSSLGTVIWKKIYGGKFTDAGVGVLQSTDGSYVALGTTQLAGIRTVMLMKTDKDGNIN